MKTCLILIDNQQALFDEGPDDAEAFLGRLTTLLAAARNAGVPVVHVQHEEPGSELEWGTPGWALHPALAPRDGEACFRKTVNSAFKETGLEDWLRERGVTDLVIAGMQTEFCIDASVKSAFERGFRITVPLGGHTTVDNAGLSAAQLNEFYSKRIWRGRFAAVEAVGAIVEGFKQGS
jgi:nicotinamidase-related amidase